MPNTLAAADRPTRKRSERASSQKRRQDILEAAKALFSEEGYDQLSLRKVASKVGIHLKTLQHYFPSKEELVQSMLEYNDSIYYQQYEDLRLDSEGPADHFAKTLQFLINDDKDKQTAGFFYQLWARAHVDGHANELMHQMYTRHCQNIADMMEPLNPELSASERKERAMMIVAMIEGMMLMIGYGKKRPEGIGDVEQQMVDLALKLATDKDCLRA